MLHGLFILKGEDGMMAYGVRAIPPGMSIDTFAKRIRAIPCAAFSARKEAEAAKARE